MEALNGADFDSDEVLCIRNKTVLKRALDKAKLQIEEIDASLAQPGADE